MNRMIALEKNPFLRLAPLFVKDFVLEFADRLAVRETTTTVSNLGRIAIDEQLAPFVRDINVLTSTNGMSFTLCSFADDLSIGISSVYANPDAIKNFCRLFSAQESLGASTSTRRARKWPKTGWKPSWRRRSSAWGGRKEAPDETV